MLLVALGGAASSEAVAQQQQRGLSRLNPFNRAPASQPLATFLPKTGVEEYVASNLDIRSFNTSVDGRRETYQARLREVGYKPVPKRSGRGPVVIPLESPDGIVVLSLFERGDRNRDGIEDVLVCFEDRRKDGSYNRSQVLLAQKYAASSPLVALDVDVRDARCRTTG